MISSEKILKLETRRQIYKIITKYPGLHLREISRRINVPLSSLRHHLRVLKKQGFIVSKSDSRFTRYYVTGKIGRDYKELMSLLRQDVPRKIILLLLVAGPAELYDVNNENRQNPELRAALHSKKELKNLTKYWKKPYDELFSLCKHSTTIEFHLKKLFDKGLIEKITVGKESKYKLKDELALSIWEFIVENQGSLSDSLVDLMITWSNRWLKKSVEVRCNVVWDIFPHPYHA
jgi:predicted transcriptional regulator